MGGVNTADTQSFLFIPAHFVLLSAGVVCFVASTVTCFAVVRAEKLDYNHPQAI
jgi:hypothetical protein